ncbi:MAG: CPBP family intramembrane metalloprotease [Candidatus Aminicenantes bacterium]|nr:CPBP family intramembrane metalloprotease [Candidatus Aminicenantes bacterium]
MKSSANFSGGGLLIASAWAFMLLVSDLPEIVWGWLGSKAPGWLPWAQVIFIALFLGLCLAWRKLRVLLPFAFVMLVFFLALRLSAGVGASPWWRARFNGPDVSFFTGYLGAFHRDIVVALAVLAALWALKKRRRDFFLVKGNVDAAVGPVRWLGIRAGERWRTFMWIFGLAAGFIVLVATALSVKISPAALAKAVPLLPAALLFAAINAFTEEVYFRASFLSTLTEVLGKNQILLISAVFFGLAHWIYGSPPGLPGFLMTGFLAWFMGKAMLETRGMLAPWLIHFIPDAVIFCFYALLWTGR